MSAHNSSRLFKLTVTAVCLPVFLLQVSCAGLTPAPGTADRAPIQRLGIATGRFQPETKATFMVAGKASGAATGAIAGATAGALVIPTVVLLACGPGCLVLAGALGPAIAAGAVVGGAAGGVGGAKTAAPAEAVAKAEQQLRSAVAALKMQQAVRARLMDYARQQRLADVRELADQGPASASDSPRYGAGDSAVVDQVLEVAIVRFEMHSSGLEGLPMSMEVVARIRLVAALSGKEIDAFHYSYRSAERPYADWAANDARLVNDELNRAYAEIAEQAVDEMLLIYRPKAPSTTASAKAGAPALSECQKPGYQREGGRAACYVLWPLTLRSHLLSFSHGSFPTVWTGCAVPKDVSGVAMAQQAALAPSLQPEFAWERFPRPFDLPSPESRITEVTYDLRLYYVDPTGPSYLGRWLYPWPANKIIDVTGLKEPHFRPQFALRPCSLYFWTVRPRFRLDGRPRTLEWSGMYEIFGPNPPWLGRRGGTVMLVPAPKPQQLYMLMATPAEGL